MKKRGDSMNQLQRIFDFRGQQMRIIEQNGESWFVASDVCKILEIQNATQALQRLEEDERSMFNIGRQGYANIINESGLYELIFASRKPEAKIFKKWIKQEVLPSIRKTGSYAIDTSQLSPELQLMNKMVQTLAKNELELMETKRIAIEAKQEANNVSNIVSLNNVGWREKVTVILKKIARNWTGIEPYRSVINLSYERFEKRAGCKLELRLNNRKERALAQGMSKSYVQKINKLDVIAEEKRLTEIYLQVIKEMAIEFRVNINDFKFDGFDKVVSS